MKLNWLRAGCASIAECGGYTALAWKADRHEGCVWNSEIRDSEGCALFATCAGGPRSPTREAAEAACETWLDQHDKPSWTDATDWLSFAEWKGCRLVCCPSSHGIYTFRVTGKFDSIGGTCELLDEAKSAAEKYVREQNAKGKSC